MILHSLALEGVGPYFERQSLTFANDERRPVTLVGGLNGSGKTTLIRSLFHMLYGARSLPELGPQRSYTRFLDESISKGREDATLELTLTVPGLRDDARLTVRRSWKRSARGVERVDVFVDDAYDEELSESWAETIEQIAPLGVARLFFFDGEKIEALADLDSAADSLRTAVGSLLGLDLVDQLQTDLVAVQRRVLRNSEKVSSKELEKREGSLAEAVELEETARDEVEKLERELAKAGEEHEKLRSASRAAGGDLVAQREELEAEIEEARRDEAAVWESLRGLAGDPLGPLSLVPELLAAVQRAASEEDRHSQAKRTLALLEQRDAWIVEEVERLGVKPVKGFANRLKADRGERAKEAGAAPAFKPATEPGRLEAARGEHLTSWRVEALRLMDALDEAMARTDEVDRRISKIPNDDSVQMLIDAVSKSREQVEEIELKLEERRQRLNGAAAHTAQARERRDAELARLAEIEDDRERQQRVHKHAERAKATLGDLRGRIARRHVGRIEQYAMQCLELLLRKERLIDAVEIDPESFAVTLKGIQGSDLRPGSLSAGERQLTALALLWSLARAAGRPLPVVIDTPLGRLDAGHRRHVVERYMPAASHQTIVLSTDTEIDADLHEALRPSVGQAWSLVNDAAGNTEILEGYLELSAA